MNQNKLIVVNSIILYVRLVIVSICGLLTTRYSLLALGVDDFGLFSVVGGVVSFIAIVNTIMLSTSNRFIAVAIGKGNIDEIQKTFNVNLVIHVMIAVCTAIIALPLGHWYILNNINYVGDVNNVLIVYNYTIFGSIISFVGVPYNGLLLAKEKFLVFCLTDILSSIVRLVFSYLLVFHFVDKLLVYSIIVSLTTAYPTLVYFIYCSHEYKSIVKFCFVRDVCLYKEVLYFSVWVGVGAIVQILKTQGTALIINSFFNTIMNAALGVANSVNNILLTFSNNVHKSIAPQIVKSFSRGDIGRSTTLVVLSSKISFLIMFSISTPFILYPEVIFGLWLGEIPPYVISFTLLIIIDNLITSLNAGIPDMVFASGKVKIYQIFVNSILGLSVVAGYYALKFGAPAEGLLISYILFSLIVLFVRQIIINRIIRFDNRAIFWGSYIPSIIISALYIPIIYLKPFLNIYVYIVLSVIYLIFLIFIIGLQKKERNIILSLLKSRF